MYVFIYLFKIIIFSIKNSKNDQMYKRVLDSPQPYRPKMLKSSRKSLDLLCVICEDHAIGFNYDVLTCASCKAFFRRNAQYQPVRFYFIF